MSLRSTLLVCALLASAFDAQATRSLASAEDISTSPSGPLRDMQRSRRAWTVRLDIKTVGASCTDWAQNARAAYIQAVSQLSGVPTSDIQASCRARTNDLVVQVLVTRVQTLRQAERMENALDRAIDTTLPRLVAEAGAVGYPPMDDVCTGVVGYGRCD